MLYPDTAVAKRPYGSCKQIALVSIVQVNCWVKVTNLSNKKSVIVHIIDRMHPRNPRLIDLSRLAAGKLGYIGKGLTKVRVEYLGRKKPADAD